MSTEGKRISLNPEKKGKERQKEGRKQRRKGGRKRGEEGLLTASVQTQQDLASLPFCYSSSVLLFAPSSFRFSTVEERSGGGRGSPPPLSQWSSTERR